MPRGDSSRRRPRRRVSPRPARRPTPRRGLWICACALLEERGTNEPIASTPSRRARMTHAVATASSLRSLNPSFRTMPRSPLRSMAGARGAAEHPPMHRLPLVYTAAYAASGDQAVAEQVAERVMLAASGERRHDARRARRPARAARRAATARSPRCATRSARSSRSPASPAPRPGGWRPCSASARRRSARGCATGCARVLSAGGAPRTPPPLRGSGSAASPGRA